MIRLANMVLVVAICGVSQPASKNKPSGAELDREKFIGAWRLKAIVGHDGKPITSGVPAGMLIYTRDGHMSVQLMYPKSEKPLSNEYVLNGYEASFGSYDVNSSAHTITHHVVGANTGALVGKDLQRVFGFNEDGNLIIKPVRREERWSVTWQHY